MPGDLETLARARYPDLSKAEVQLLQAATLGLPAVCGPTNDDTDASNDPANAIHWRHDREIRAELIHWLCADRQAKDLVERIIEVFGARITGTLDLAFLTITFPLAFENCLFMNDAVLLDVGIPDLNFSATWVRSILADRAKVGGNVFFRKGFRAEGEVRLLGAHIGGDLDCIDGKFITPLQQNGARSGDALRADNATISGNVILRNGFQAEGRVRLVGAQVGGDIDCESGTFLNPPNTGMDTFGAAIDADGVVVGGNLYLRNAFHSEGAVRLLGAQVGATLDCRGGTFINPPRPGIEASGVALHADRANIKGEVFFDEGFRAAGEVRIAGAQIEGQLTCSGGTFTNPGQPGHFAFSAEDAFVKRNVLFGYGFRAEGEVRLPGAQIGGNLDCTGGTFKNSGNVSLLADRVKVAGSVFLHQCFAEGEIGLLGAQIGSNLECHGGTFKNPAKIALNAEGAIVTGSVFFCPLEGKTQNFRAEGEVRLTVAQIGGALDCRSAELKNPNAYSLSVDRAKVAGSIFLTNRFSAQGGVELRGTQIGADLICDGGTFKNPGETALNAEGAHIAGGVFLPAGFSSDGEVRLFGAQIEADLDCSGGNFKNPGKTALNADRTKTGSDVLFRDDFSSDGEVRLFGAQIGADFSCSGGKFKNPGKIALNAEQVNVAQSVFLRNDFTSEGRVWLLGAQIGADLDCSGGTFTELAAPTAVVKGNLFWREVANGQQEKLDLTSASAGALADDKRSWPGPGNLVLDGFVYARISDGPTDAPSRLDWLSRQPQFASQPYRQLAKVLAEMGNEEGARKVLVELERRQREAQWILSPAFRLTVGYGYAPLRTLWWLGGLSALGWLIFWRAKRLKAMAPTDGEAYKLHRKDEPLANYPRFNSLLYATENLFPLIKFGQADKWQPDPESPGPWDWRRRWWRIWDWPGRPRFLRVWVVVLVSVGWLLAAFLAAGVVGLLRKP